MEKGNIIAHLWRRAAFGPMFLQLKKHAVIFEAVKHLYFTQEVLQDIHTAIGKRVPEQGGIIGGYNDIVTDFYYDRYAQCNNKEYIPDFNELNKQIRFWALKNVKFLGIIHSHPVGYDMLSQSDIHIAREILNNTTLIQEIFLLILEAPSDNVISSLHGFCIY